MKYRLEISSVAEAEVDSIFLRLSQVTSAMKVSQWYAGLLEAIESLLQMPLGFSRFFPLHLTGFM